MPSKTEMQALELVERLRTMAKRRRDKAFGSAYDPAKQEVAPARAVAETEVDVGLEEARRRLRERAEAMRCEKAHEIQEQALEARMAELMKGGIVLGSGPTPPWGGPTPMDGTQPAQKVAENSVRGLLDELVRVARRVVDERTPEDGFYGVDGDIIEELEDVLAKVRRVM